MARERDPFGEALDTLRQRLRDGLATPGGPLIVMDLARTLRISATPIREALARLAGEGLVEDRRGRGYTARRLEAADLVDLYRLHGWLVRFALDGAALSASLLEALAAPTPGVRATGALEPGPGAQRRTETEVFWQGVAALAGNRALDRTMSALTDHLSLARLVEGRVFDDFDSELILLRKNICANNMAEFRTICERYHARRCSMAGTLAAMIRDRSDR